MVYPDPWWTKFIWFFLLAIWGAVLAGMDNSNSGNWTGPLVRRKNTWKKFSNQQVKICEIFYKLQVNTVCITVCIVYFCLLHCFVYRCLLVLFLLVPLPISNHEPPPHPGHLGRPRRTADSQAAKNVGMANISAVDHTKKRWLLYQISKKCCVWLWASRRQA